MKRIYISISALLLCGNLLFAQTLANRTPKTVAIDVLAQMPAAKQAAYNKQIKELVSAGEDAVLTLTDMINAPGKGSNAQVDYALSGLSHYVMAQGKEKERSVISKAYIKALEQTGERETKAFLIRQLQIVGQDEAVETLAAYLKQPELSGPAARALSSIGTKKAGEALKVALQQASSTDIQQDVLEAIAEMQVEGTETLIQSFAGTSDADLRKVSLYALSRVGSEASLKILADAAKEVHYTMEPSGANEAYIALIRRVAAQGSSKVAEKAAVALHKAATKAKAHQTREAALGILFSLAEKDDISELLLKALKDGDKRYRNAALNFASLSADKELYTDLYKKLDKCPDPVKVDLISWIGRESKCPEKHGWIEKLKLQSGMTGQDILLKQLESSVFQVKEATVWTLVKIGDRSILPNLAALLKSDDKQVVLLAQDALTAFNGNITDVVVDVIQDATDAGKIAALELLAMRKADSCVDKVKEQIKSGSPEVKKVAYKVLKDVVVDSHFGQLCDMLEDADASAVSDIQLAVISSLGFMPEKQRVGSVKERMSKAGKDQKDLYYSVLAATAEKEALNLIVEGFEKGNEQSKKAAFDALLSWKTMDVAGVLFNICKNSKQAALSDKAIERYVNLVGQSDMTGENRLLLLRNAMEISRTTKQKNQILKYIEKCGTFQALLYAGKFLDDKSIQQSAANAVMNIALDHKEFYGENVRVLLAKVTQVLDNPDAGYQKESIKKHLSEMPTGPGFVSLFNGNDLTGWKGLVKNPIARSKMKAAELAKEQEKADQAMRESWSVENGVLAFNGKGDNLCTEKQYGDFEMYIDWKLDPAGPEADAGVYLRGTPQVQIWDTARVKVGAQVGSGGLYNNQKYARNPLKVADNPLGEWNTFYIKMVGDRVTVLLNGELVVDNVIMENYWDRKSPIFPIEQIELQAHGSKVYYRDIYLKELERKEPFVLSAEEEKEGFKVLFDGTNMHEWQGNTKDYILEDGAISMIPSKSFGGNLYTKEKYANFVFRFEFQLTPGANNGIGIRTEMGVNAAYEGMEIQVLDCEHPIYRRITPLQHHGSVYGIIPSNENHKHALKPAGEWNEEEIVADGDNIRVTVNGVVILEGNIRDAVKNGTADKKEHPGLFNKEGYIGFLGHGSPVRFKNIRIKELK